MGPDRELILVADPMCSWCWGFAPVMAMVARQVAERAPLRIVVGGLRAGGREDMGDTLRAYVRDAWTTVARTTGQEFNFAFFERPSFVYDTEPACRAVVSVRRLAPARTLDFLEAVQRAFYLHNVDVTSADELTAIAGRIGVDRAAFAAHHASGQARDETAADFAAARELGISGFPTLLGRDAEGLSTLSSGYRPASTLLPAVEAWLG